MEKLSGNELLQHEMLRDIDDVFRRRGVDAGSVERKLSLGEGKSSLTVHFRGENPSPGDQSDYWSANIVGNVFSDRSLVGNIIVRTSGVEAWQLSLDDDSPNDLVAFGEADWAVLRGKLDYWQTTQQQLQAA